MVDERSAHLEAELHGRDVDLDEDVVGQVRADVELEQTAECVGSRGPREDPGEPFGRRIAREPLAQLVRVNLGLLGGGEVTDEPQVARGLVGAQVMAVLADPSSRATGNALEQRGDAASRERGQAMHRVRDVRPDVALVAAERFVARVAGERDRDVLARHLREHARRHRRRIGERLAVAAHHGGEQVHRVGLDVLLVVVGAVALRDHARERQLGRLADADRERLTGLLDARAMHATTIDESMPPTKRRRAGRPTSGGPRPHLRRAGGPRASPRPRRCPRTSASGRR